MNIIDFHTHIFPPEQIARRDQLTRHDTWFAQLYGNPRARMSTAEELLSSAERNGISRSVVFGFPWQDRGGLRESNDYVFESAKNHPEKLIPFVTLPPNDTDAAEAEFSRTRPVPVRGIGELMPDGNGYRLSDAEVMSVSARFAIERGIPLLTHVSEPFGHTYPGKGRTYAQEILELARAFPELKIVCGHWGGGLIFYELQSEVAAELTNVYYDTSASCYVYDNSIYPVAGVICPEKVLFGTDFPACPVDRQLRAITEAPIPDEMKEKILSTNAERLLS